MVVVKGKNECLPSFQTSKLLNILTLNVELVHQVQAGTLIEHDLVSLTEKFPKLFSGKLGCMKNFEVKLDVDESIRPVRKAQRPFAFHLRPMVEKELRHQVEQGILEFVDDSMGPTPWISNLVIVPKDKEVSRSKLSKPVCSEKQFEFEIRLTCDNRSVKKAIRRVRYPLRR